jgi:hypothetical protein
LTGEEAKKRLAEYGPNKLPESTRNPILVGAIAERGVFKEQVACMFG